MPEAPELDAAVSQLREYVVGQAVERLDVAAINVLATAQPPADSLVGRTLAAVRRRGKHLVFDFEGRFAVLHLALAGWVKFQPEVPPMGRSGRRPGKGPLALRFALEDGSALEVTEQGTKKSVKLWVSDEPEQLETLARLGPEAGELKKEDFAAILGSTSSQLKTVLTDQERMAGIGNAWSDEILHRAQMSPFAAANRLDEESSNRLFEALRETLDIANSGLRGVKLDRIKATKKKLLRVHGRAGQECPVCGDTIAQVSFADRSLEYCPTCQTGGKKLNDRRMDRLLK